MKQVEKLKLIKYQYFEQFQKMLNFDIPACFVQIEKNEQNFDKFYFYFSSSAVYSSNIEGNSVDFDTYCKYKTFNIKGKGKEIKEIEDLISAYQFAKVNVLNLNNLLLSHKTLSKSFLIKSNRGKLRTQKVGVFSENQLIYLAIEPEYLKNEIEKLFADIDFLLKNDLTICETFYYAAIIHLIFVKIHPFMDGNGRAARLLEKWFLAQKSGEIAWHIQSEKYYFQKRAEYYQNVHIGVNYYELDYNRCLPFLLMLPNCLMK